MSIEQDRESVVFDMAGTTVLDNGEAPAAFSSALAGYGVEVTPEQMGVVPPRTDREQVAENLYGPFQDLAHCYASGELRGIAGAEQTRLAAAFPMRRLPF